VVCGPTASGKSELSDALADELTGELGARVQTLVIDAMQVYREIPAITNQARRRAAELVGIVSVTEEWTVAVHKERFEKIIEGRDAPFVLDAGTGMYLNAIILDVRLAPRVEAQTRTRAQSITAGAPNPRRAARAKELELAGAPLRGSIWDGDPRYHPTIIYLRPNRETLDKAIARRSGKIVRDGLEEATQIRAMSAEGASINVSVAHSIGVRELVSHLEGAMSIEEAEDRISARTRKLARRQSRWFDKLARALQGRAKIQVLENPSEIDRELLNCMHDRIEA
jgi:tRNA dimethylallyltransferase